MTGLKISQISANLVNLIPFIPREFARKPRSLAFVKRWKATELRLFLLYIGVVVLKNVVPDEIYSLFLLLFVSSRILSYPHLVKIPSWVDYAENLIQTFVQHCADKSVFGESFVVYNVHSILHVCDDVRRFGVMTNFSSFPFENHLGIIKRMVRSGVKVTQQIARRLSEIDSADVQPNITVSSNKLTPCDFVEATNKSLKSSDYVLIPHIRKESFFIMGESVGRLKKIQKVGSRVELTADVCESLENFFTYPIESRKIGVFKFTNWTAHDVIIDVSAINGKVMVLPWLDELVAIHLLHT